MSEWFYVAIYAGAVVGLGLGILGVASFFGPRRYQKSKGEPYECGVPLLSSAHERFSVHFYLVAILFILFDIETVFLIPWAVQSVDLGVEALCAILIFLGIIVFGLLYEWRRGALEWE